MKYMVFLLLFGWAWPGFAQQDLRGHIVNGEGAGIALRAADGTVRSAVAGPEGWFALQAPAGRYRLKVSFTGYRDTVLAVELPRGTVLEIALRRSAAELREVRVSTGYQDLPADRATGSFVQVDRALIERSVGTSVLDRLHDVVPGLAFTPGGSTFRIRGQSTIFSNADPLIVVDGFSYNQPVTDLNPNDVESVTVLKDAAAAAIWGSRAGNGVVVITTKQGGFNRPAQVSFSGSLQAGQRPDLFYGGRMSAADYIGLEQRLFSENYYTATENSAQHLPLSPVVELLIARRDGKQSAAAVAGQLADLANQDIRNDVSKYGYRPSFSQQYAASVSGGSAAQRYFFSAGADRNLDNAAGNGYERLTLKGTNTWAFLDHRLEFTAGLYLSETRTNRDNPGTLTWNRGNLIYPYAALKDANGNNAALTHDYRPGFLASAQNGGLLDWQYRPLDELEGADNESRVSEQRVNTGLKYRLPLGFSAQLLYQYDRGLTTGRNLQGADSYYTRNLVNRYTQVSGTTLSRPVPLGGILDLGSSNAVNHDLRAQLDFDRAVAPKQQLTAFAGYEVQSLHVLGDGNRFYGYDAEHAAAKPVDGTTIFNFYDYPVSGGPIPLNNSESDATDHYLSYYASAAWTWDRRLTLSGSARLDRSNLFGVNANQKGVPLWSAGAAWVFGPGLRTRATYGYNGNINKSLSAYTTANYLDGSQQGTGLPFAQIINPPNSELRWERVRNIDLGLDFATKDGRVKGTLDYYLKTGIDLIGSTAYAPSTGITTFTGNTAGTSGHGLDLSLSSRNLAGKLQWQTDFFLSYVTDRVTDYGQVSTTASYVQSGQAGGYPLSGRPLYAVYSYNWAGLDPQTGDPQGYLNGALSKNYTAIMAATAPQDLVYNGPARPTVFGALRNTLTYRAWSLSANIAYRLGYDFRRTSVRYGNDDGLSQQSGDFALRWQQPGDEQHTQVPALTGTPNTARDDFYTYASVLVEKGDNIRLQDIRLSYRFQRIDFYTYAANLGILWKAAKTGLDPDYPNSYPPPLTLAGGIRFTY